MGVFYETGQNCQKNLAVSFSFYLKSSEKCYHPGKIFNFLSF